MTDDELLANAERLSNRLYGFGRPKDALLVERLAAKVAELKRHALLLLRENSSEIDRLKSVLHEIASVPVSMGNETSEFERGAWAAGKVLRDIARSALGAQQND